MPSKQTIVANALSTSLARIDDAKALEKLADYHDGIAAQVRAAADRLRSDNDRRDRAEKNYQTILQAVDVKKGPARRRGQYPPMQRGEATSFG